VDGGEGDGIAREGRRGKMGCEDMLGASKGEERYG